MKKLLTLLGSVGMVAATAATVVACNKPKEETFDATIKAGAEGKINVLDADIAKFENFGIKDLDADSAKIVGDVKFVPRVGDVLAHITFKGKAEGKAKIVLEGSEKKATKDTTTPVKKDIKTFTVKVEKAEAPTIKNLNDFKMAAPQVGDVKTEVATKIQTALATFAPGVAAANYDLAWSKATANAELNETVTITAKKDEASAKLITGSKVLTTVAKHTAKDLKDFTMEAPKVGDVKTAVATKIQEELAKFVPGVAAANYDLAWSKATANAELNETVTITAKKDEASAKLITGSKVLTTVAKS
ncbi:lipoprotein [Williamsoniiplasma luminosum]|uniref:Lipoprotein n=1 Tax=Williamsoniiplasma luminosum TaxID=214888 RepID=A0A2S0NK48_9MOLU|nr:lipoprotein [Williamsoniiplasma luminosum]AVP49393.1 MAG: hypothetical protein C5T88_02235 [Williamsoniiplasma luminosum]